MKITNVLNNFQSGEVDNAIQGRFELPLYNTSLAYCKNFFSNYKGNLIYSTGFERMVDFQDCGFLLFRYTTSELYICVLYANKMRFLSYDVSGVFGWVLDGSSNILEVATPYTLAHSKEISFRKSSTQDRNSLIIVHKSYQPMELKRVSATNFTLKEFPRKFDPFIKTTGATKTITGITQATNAVVTAVAHGYATGQRIKITGVVGMTQINEYAVTITSLTANTFSTDLDTTSFTAYSSGGLSTIISAGDYPATTLYYNGRIYYAGSIAKPTTIWGSEIDGYDIFELPSTILDESAFQFTLAGISQAIEWLYAGENSLIAGAGDGVLAINGGGVNVAIKADTIQSNLTSAAFCNLSEPLKKDGLIFYVSFDGRSVNYFKYDILTESFLSDDSNLLSYDITEGGINKIQYVNDKSNLIYALKKNGELLSLNFSEKEKILGWTRRTTNGLFKDIISITDNNGKSQLFALVLRNGSYYIERLADIKAYKSRNDYYTGTKEVDNLAYIRYLGELLKKCCYLDNSTFISDLRTATITLSGTTLTAGAASFTSSDVGKVIVYKSDDGRDYGRLEIVGFTSTTIVTVNVLIAPSKLVYSSWYLSFDKITGLSRFNGQTVALVADGGYYADFTVSGGLITTSTQIHSACVGLKYTGEAQTFSIGTQVKGENTQSYMKLLTKIGVRLNFSAGGKIGSSRYELNQIQELTQQDVNYNPPILINGTKYINIMDKGELDKSIYIIQDQPLPFDLAALFIDIEYAK
jgi:hypothetical protein